VADLKWDPLSWLVYEAGSEDHLAEQMVRERKWRGWSQERLAKEMTMAGCPTSQSSISKIERPVGGRRRDITAEEAIALSRVFRRPLGELLLPANAEGDLLSGFASGPRLARELEAKEGEYQTVVAELAERTRGLAEWDQRIRDQLDFSDEEIKTWTGSGHDQEEVARARRRFLDDLIRAREESK
jgi:transcriptional regulator with XRE-family HTH domain